MAPLPRPVLCSPLTLESGAESEHENTPKAEVTGEPIAMGCHCRLTVRSVINGFFFSTPTDRPHGRQLGQITSVFEELLVYQATLTGLGRR